MHYQYFIQREKFTTSQKEKQSFRNKEKYIPNI